jgi:asparagine synthase (glutamine-hydrolysing)
MRDYLVIESQAQADPAIRRDAEARLLESGAWTKVAERRWFSVFVEAAKPPAYRHLPGVAGGLIGEIFDSQAAREGLGRPLDLMGFGAEPDALASSLVDRGFGRYVAILNDDRGPARVLRDPLGAMNALGWRRGALRFIGSRLPDMRELWPIDLALDPEAVAQILRQKNLASQTCPLIGIHAYPPGVLADASGRGPALWSPAAFVRRTGSKANPADLRQVVDGVVAAWAQGRTGILCEMSGGLDSAIVATSLAKVAAPVCYGLNHAYPEKEGDERGFAQDLADQVGVPLVVVEREQLELTPDKFVAGADGMRLNYAGGDPDHDVDLAERLSAPDIDMLFTGSGGDGVLYQPAHPSLVRDVLKGMAGSRLAALDVLARRQSTTAWSILRRGLAPQDLTVGGGVQRFLSDAVAARPAALHPWLAQAKAVGPAKQLQILMIVNGLGAFGDTRHHQVADVVDPLLSQPVVEYCLAVPAGVLAIGTLNRPFARRAFADRLPPSILARGSKGDVTRFFLQNLAASLDALRPFLLEGRLAQMGLLDLKRVDEALSADQMIWSNFASQVFILLSMEAWTRHWPLQASNAQSA